MNLIQHSATALAGFGATAGVLAQVPQTLPQSKTEIIALVSAVVVQSIIYGVTKLFGWLSKKNEPKTN